MRLRGRESNPDFTDQNRANFQLFDPAEKAVRIAMVSRGQNAGEPGHDAGRYGTRRVVRDLLSRGYSVSQAARELRLSAATVSYHRRKLGFEPSRKYAARKDWAEIQRFYDEGHSVRECEARFGFSSRSWGRAVGRGDLRPRPPAVPIAALLVKGPTRGRGHVKRRLLSEGLKQNRCEDCGIDRWMDEPLNMALHHINGDGTDNRLENLRLLCANCHSQTPNFARKRGARPG